MAAELEVGDRVSDFTVQCVWCNEFTLSEQVKKHPILFYFYPVNYGMQCTAYSQLMNDYYDDLEKIGVKMFHVTLDTIDCHKGYMRRLDTRFDHAADTDHNVCRIFGMILPSSVGLGAAGMTTRGFALVDKDMILRYVWRGPSTIHLLDFQLLIAELGEILTNSSSERTE